MQHADLHAALGQPGGQCRDHRRPTGVVNAAGEDDVEVFARPATAKVLRQHLDHRLPQDEAGPRPDVPAALPPLEDEPPATVLQEHPQQAGRRDVQVRRDALLFEFLRLIRPAAGDDGERRLGHCGSLRFARGEFPGNEA